MATIAQVRDNFRRLSGRFDLTTAQIDEYLNRGQMYLDEVTDFQKAPQRLQASLVHGQALITFTSALRSIREVWIADTEDRYKVDKVSDAWLRATYSKALASQDQGRPLYYVPDPLTYRNASGLFLWGTVVFEDSFDENGLLLLPVADGSYQVEVVGRFYSPVISDSQGSWWLTNHPRMLERAALRELEGDYRNSAGIKDHENAMSATLNSLMNDQAEEDSQDIVQMEG